MCAETPPIAATAEATTSSSASSSNNENEQQSCTEKFGDQVDAKLFGTFSSLGSVVGNKPRWTLVCSILLTFLCGAGFVRWETENRPEELWVPQDTVAEQEEAAYTSLFPPTARINTMIVQSSSGSSSSSNGNNNKNVLTADHLQAALELHQQMETLPSTTTEGGTNTLVSLCAPSGGACVDGSETSAVCQCLMTSILRQWNYDLATFQADDDYMTTLQQYGSRADLEAVLGNAVFDETTNELISAEAFTLSYFLADRSVTADGEEKDPINEAWEKDVFLNVTQNAVPTVLEVDYFSSRSFADEFGDAISGDLILVQVSYVVAFFFLGATLGNWKCGTGSRWTMALAALVMVGLSTAAGFGVSAAFGLFFGPVHSLLPFVLLGIGVDDAFVIVNAMNRERHVQRSAEDNGTIASRCARALGRAGASITVTSATDLVAFAISSSSALPALASFCAYAAISIFFLWTFASTFFTAALVLDERRQRDNRRECLCCVTRNGELQEEDEDELEAEGFVSRYFRNYHAKAILSPAGKTVVLIIFTGLLCFGFYGAANLSVEDSERNFIPPDSYINDYVNAADEYFPDSGLDLFITFTGSADIYAQRQELAALDTQRLTGLSTAPPYIAEPVSAEAYRNVMTGLYQYMAEQGTDAIGGAELGEDGWPTSEADFVATLQAYASFSGPGAAYAQDVAYYTTTTNQNNGQEQQPLLDGFRVELEYVKLVKTTRNGEVIDDSDKLIDAMDATRDMVDSWVKEDGLPAAFPYSEKFLAIEGFKIIRRELFQNVGLAILAVGIIVFFTVASPVTAILITLNVAFCIIEILGFMYAVGIVIDSVSVINIVLAVGLSVDYSAHIGHCFMVKGGSDRNVRVTETLADIGAAVLSGATSTFLAVAVLLVSSSYVFETLSKQFALTVGLGVLHGLVLLPVVLSLLGPKPFSSAELPAIEQQPQEEEDAAGGALAVVAAKKEEQLRTTAHMDAQESISDDGNDNDNNNNAETMGSNIVPVASKDYSVVSA